MGRAARQRSAGRAWYDGALTRTSRQKERAVAMETVLKLEGAAAPAARVAEKPLGGGAA